MQRLHAHTRLWRFLRVNYSIFFLQRSSKLRLPLLYYLVDSTYFGDGPLEAPKNHQLNKKYSECTMPPLCAGVDLLPSRDFSTPVKTQTLISGGHNNAQVTKGQLCMFFVKWSQWQMSHLALIWETMYLEGSIRSQLLSAAEMRRRDSHIPSSRCHRKRDGNCRCYVMCEMRQRRGMLC